MNYRLLGRSGLRVSDLALGTMLFGATTDWGVDAATAAELYAVYRDAGGNYLDTANQYAGGESERILGGLVGGHRDEVVIASKYTNSAPNGRDPNAAGNQRKNMVQSVEGSLRRLGTDRLDVLVVHAWDLLTPVEEVMRGLDDLVRAGKVLYVAVSNTPAWVVARSVTMAELRGWTAYVGVQIEYSLLARTAEAEFLPLCTELGLSVLAWSPLKNGLLTGKYAGADSSATAGRLGTRTWTSPAMAWADPLGGPGAGPVLAALASVAGELGVPPAQVALAWLRHRPVHVVPVVGATRADQLRTNLASAGVALTAEQVAGLDAASAVPQAYPHPYLDSPMARSFRSAGLGERISL
ncbi:aldo/keto reductase [Nocardioides panacihumi]|uniref:aldo/keto reductase n=1 Tax=Nocardioides panacihumi TaxID=400774 RepID=UPI0031D81D7E